MLKISQELLRSFLIDPSLLGVHLAPPIRAAESVTLKSHSMLHVRIFVQRDEARRQLPFEFISRQQPRARLNGASVSVFPAVLYVHEHADDLIVQFGSTFIA